MKAIKQRRKYSPPVLGRNDHEAVNFKGWLIPVLGTVGGTKEQSRETARNIECYFVGKKGGAA